MKLPPCAYLESPLPPFCASTINGRLFLNFTSMSINLFIKAANSNLLFISSSKVPCSKNFNLKLQVEASHLLLYRPSIPQCYHTKHNLAVTQQHFMFYGF